MVLLSIRTALKEDIHCITAELVYGTSLCLPGEFFTHTQDDGAIDQVSYVTELKATMQQLRVTPVCQSRQWNVHINDALTSCTHVHDAVKKPLQQPYDGPYKVLEWADKYYYVDINGRRNRISLDRLKPVYYEPSEPASHEAVSPALITSTTPTPANATIPHLPHSYS